jgi:tRNA(fMet)-specific endonuclease VapC
MSNVVVDTNVVSYLFKSHSIAFQYLPDIANQTPLISFMTIAELDRWVLEARWGDARRKRLLEYLEPFAVLRPRVMYKVGRGHRSRAIARAPD